MSDASTFDAQHKQYKPELLRAIGALLVSAAFGENYLSLQVTRIARPGDPFDVSLGLLLSGMEFRQKLNKIRMLVSAIEGYKNHYKLIDRHCRKIETAFGIRNLFAHGLLEPSDKNPAKIVMQDMSYNAIRGDWPQRQTFSAEDIFFWAHAIRERIGRLDQAITAAGCPQLDVALLREFPRPVPQHAPDQKSDNRD